MANQDLLEELVRFGNQLVAEGKPFINDGNGWVKFDADGKEIAADLAWYACTHPTFAALGLRRQVLKHAHTRKNVYGEPQIGPERGWCHVGIGAMQLVLDITRQEAEYIFGADDESVLSHEGWQIVEDGEYPQVDYSIQAILTRLQNVIDDNPRR